MQTVGILLIGIKRGKTSGVLFEDNGLDGKILSY
jgi:hypothetical protein